MSDRVEEFAAEEIEEPGSVIRLRYETHAMPSSHSHKWNRDTGEQEAAGPRNLEEYSQFRGYDRIGDGSTWGDCELDNLK